ncbi:5-oxoprolinase subunit PxpA [Vibrio breoganii]
MKLNCDMGESLGAWTMGNDAQIMPLIDMANIACGFHASDPDTMSATIALAKEHGVSIGAHPGYADLQGFGRRSIPHTSAQITHLILYQVGALQGICRLHQASVDYIKPHGALYNDMMKDVALFTAIVEAAKQLQLPLMVLATDNADYLHIAQRANVALIHEGFVDRRYTQDKQLSPRGLQGAVMNELDEVKHQAQALISGSTFSSIDNSPIQVAADTLCVHGDGSNALIFAQHLRHLISEQAK